MFPILSHFLSTIICDDFFNEEAWIRNDAAELLGIEGYFNEVTGDGSETACDINVELAIAQRRISSDFYLASACARRPEVADNEVFIAREASRKA